MTDNLLKHIESRRPRQVYKAGEQIPHKVFTDVMNDLFPATSHKQGGMVFENAYQLEQAVTTVGDWYGCGLRCSGTAILCACGKTQKQQKDDLDKHQRDCSDFSPQQKDNPCKRNRSAQSDLECPMFIKYTPLTKLGSGKKIDTPVRITSTNYIHNHGLSKEMLIRAKRQCHKYSVPMQSCLEIMKLSRHGPIPIKTLRGYMQELFPNTQHISAKMVGNLRLKMEQLARKYPNVNAIPGTDLKRIFEPSSMEIAPENIFEDPVMALAFEEAMIETLIGSDPSSFELIKIMERVKSAQPDGYDYRVYRGEDGRPRGVIQMTASQKMNDLRYGDIGAVDVQHKYKNSLGWVYWSMTSTNNNKKITNFCDSLTLSETDHFQAFALRAKCEMSGRPISSIKVIPVDGKTSEDYLRKALPG